MSEFLRTPTAQLVIWLTVGAALLLVGVYVVLYFRRQARQKPQITHQILTEMREWRDQGELSDEEFRQIKTRLASKLQEEVPQRRPRKPD